jgi:hypothetical protein
MRGHQQQHTYYLSAFPVLLAALSQLIDMCSPTPSKRQERAETTQMP